ncbi:MAG: T9SS type A sorting domain-containing protein [Rhodothermales bacterium]
MRLLLNLFAFLVLFLPVQAHSQTSSSTIDQDIELAVTTESIAEGVSDKIQKVVFDTFDVVFEGDTMILQWSTLTEHNNARFEVERSIKTHDRDMGPWRTLSFVAGEGTTDTTSTYSYHDKGDLTGASRVMYRLKQVSFDGSSQHTETIEAELPAPLAFAVSSYPNPYVNTVTIEYDIPEQNRVRLTVYNEGGRLIKTLVNKRIQAGRYRVEFDASNEAPGLYMYRLEVAGRVWIEPILLIQ